MSDAPTCGHIQYGDQVIPIVDCKQWRLRGRDPNCEAGHDLSQCGSCIHRISRGGNFTDPPVIGAGLPPKIPQFEPPMPAGESRFRGLGDVVAAVTTAVGIRPCGGCKKRQEALNRLVPFAGAETPPAAAEQPEATQTRLDGPDAA